MKPSPIARAVWLGIGLLSVALGVIGIFLPIMPTVPFLILAAFCFARSNRAWEERLMNHPIYGPSIRNWRDHGAIGRRGKWMASVAFAASLVFGHFTLAWPWVLLPPAIAAISLSWIWTRPEV